MPNNRVLFIYRILQNKSKYKGIYDKMEGQIAALDQQSYSVDFITLSSEGMHFNGECVIYRTLNHSMGIHWYNLQKFYRDLIQSINPLDYDFIYLRHTLQNKYSIQFFKYLKHQNPALKIYLEIPTFPYEKEYKGWLQKSALWVDRRYRMVLHKYIDHIVHFGTEDEIWNIPCIHIQNGIRHSIFRETRPKGSDPLILIGVGNIASWWGLAALFTALKNHCCNKTQPKIEIRILGEGKEKKNLEQWIKSEGLEDWVKFYGFIEGKALTELLHESHIGIGTLDPGSKDLAKTSSLKHRLYAAHGLPFFYKGNDSNFEHLSWVFRFTDHQEIDLNHIIEWFTSLENDANLFKSIYNYAQNNLTWDTQFLPVIESMKKTNR